MVEYDLSLAWNWEHDADFAALLGAACRSRSLSLVEITPANLAAARVSLLAGEMAFRALYDRASDTDARFIPVVEWARDHGVHAINSHDRARRSWDKATMHLEFITAGLHTPYTIILPPYQEQPILPPLDLSPLGESFAIKPAHGGGGEGVVTRATSLKQVHVAQQERPTDKILLQAHIVPAQLGSRPAWFRAIYCLGRVYPCWWDTATHVYTMVTAGEEGLFGLGPLIDITAAIARVCQLELFSTEIALIPDGRFIVVDYVNDQLDLRLQSHHPDGVPDGIVHDIAERLAAHAAPCGG